MAITLALAVGSFALYTFAFADSLTGSKFEIDKPSSNLKVDTAGNLDWDNVSETRKQDDTSGSGDNSFGQGTKEDTEVPSVVTGGIPPNKSDLKTFGVYLENNGSSGRFLNVFWHRVQDPSGTTNMDFEFNKSSLLSGNGVTPVRSQDDVLIQYDLANGGVNPELFLSKWETTGAKSLCEAANATPCWGKRIPLSSSGDAIGSINTLGIPLGEADGLGAISPRTFGEASIDFDALADSEDPCTTFGSAYLKSRSSDSFTAALKDFIAPEKVNLSNCGSVKIIKTDDAGAPLAGAVFELYNDNAPTGGTRGDEDTATGQACTTGTDGTCTIDDVVQGEYWVVETTTPAGHDPAADQHVTVTPSTTPVELTFVDPRQRGAIKVTKLRKHAADGAGDHPQSGVAFTIKDKDGNQVGSGTTDAQGKVCVDNLLFGDYTVHETTPSGYHGEADKTVTVNNKAGCGDATYGGETVTFHNTPLSNITVSASPQVTGATASKITCGTLAADPADGTPNAFDDTTETYKDLEPGTYTCTVVIDP